MTRAMEDIFNQIKEDANAFMNEAEAFVERQKQFNDKLKTQRQ